jgi:hypothetical protein
VLCLLPAEMLEWLEKKERELGVKPDEDVQT